MQNLAIFVTLSIFKSDFDHNTDIWKFPSLIITTILIVATAFCMRFKLSLV